MSVWKILHNTGRPGARWERLGYGPPQRMEELFAEHCRARKPGILIIMDSHDQVVRSRQGRTRR